MEGDAGGSQGRIHRPRQIYMGEVERPFLPMKLRAEAKTTMGASEPELVSH